MSDRYLELYINDILESIDSIFSYITDTDFDEFSNNRMKYSAVIREFEIIGEATKKIPKEIRQKYKTILWRDIIDFRNLLIHEYFGVDHKILWNTIHQDLPPLKQIISEILTQPKE